jgi:hypothetical protein
MCFVPELVDASAASSPAHSGPVDELAALSATDLHAWRMTGNLPDPSTVVADDAATPAATAVQDPPASTDAISEPVAEPAAEWTPARLKPETKKRFDTLLTEKSAATQRAERAEARLRELEARQTQPAETRPAASSNAPAGLVKPDPDQFPYGTSDPAYLDARDTYNRAVWHAEGQQAREEQLSRGERQKVIDAFNARLEKERLDPTFNEAVAMGPSEIPPKSVTEMWAIEDEAGLKILNHINRPEHAAERRRILALGPREQLKELVRLGDRLTGTAAARPASLDPPPATLSTRKTAGDVLASLSAEDADDPAWTAEMNRRDIARRLGR